ncbi:MAG: hypothetical protein U0U69_11095 [Acidimicrobiia bacterium]
MATGSFGAADDPACLAAAARFEVPVAVDLAGVVFVVVALVRVDFDDAVLALAVAALAPVLERALRACVAVFGSEGFPAALSRVPALDAVAVVSADAPVGLCEAALVFDMTWAMFGLVSWAARAHPSRGRGSQVVIGTPRWALDSSPRRSRSEL